MRVLVTGASGFVGRTVCPALTAAGHRVTAAVRTPPEAPVEGAGTTVAVGDIGPDTDWSAAFDGAEAVVHLAARVHRVGDTDTSALDAYRRTNVDGTRRLANAAAAAGIRRFVFLSSVKVHGDASPPGRALSEEDPPAPTDAYGISKWEAEQALADVAGGGTLVPLVLRPPLVYGPGVGANFGTLMRAVAKGWPLPLGAVRNRRSLIYVDNLADAVRAALGHDGGPRTWLVSDGEDVSTPELVRRIARAFGRPARLMPVPVALLRLAGTLTGRGDAVARLTGSLAVDIARIRDDLGWTPPVSMLEGLAATTAWYRTTEGDRSFGRA